MFGLLLSSTAGLKCYLSDKLQLTWTVANNDDEKRKIKHPFSEGTLEDCGSSCVKQHSSVDGEVHRACWSDYSHRLHKGCTTFDMGLGKQIVRCFCNTDGCNGGSRKITSLSVMFALILSFFFL